MPHQDIANRLYTKHKINGWWAQMVTVGYEQARGLREVHEKAGAYAASASKTVCVPLGRLYRVWADDKARSAWLGRQAITIRKATPKKSMRITWQDSTSVSVYFNSQGAAKSQVAIDHEKLASNAAVTKMKAFWGKALDTLKKRLEA